VGTTSTRTIESLYWLGRKVFFQPEITQSQLVVGQWEPYETKELCSTKEALEALLSWLERKQLTSILSKTQIIIAPGYTFRIIHGIITNFHQPESTLLLLISALIGEDWKKVYDYALENDFRFLSYGDGSLLWGSK
jgi:S-adenosylmethionine:tRNA ribosyltransferase-isomerase